MMEPIRYREHSFRPDNDPVWRKRGLKTFLPRRLLALVSSESGDAQAQQRTAGEAILSPSSLTGNEAQNFCARENRSLAEASVVAELFNGSNDLAQTVYWTGSNYRGRRDVLWALDLSNANRPLPEEKVLMNNQIATAYPVTDFRAVAVCVEKPQ